MKKKKKSEYTEKLLITNFLKNCKRHFFFFFSRSKRDFNKPKNSNSQYECMVLIFKTKRNNIENVLLI